MPLSTRYFIKLSYNGKEYHGWQVQPNAKTVQEELQKSLSTVLQEDIHIIGCGRTDTGVHAKEFYAHFDCSNSIIENENFVFKINCILPKDIAITNIRAMHAEAHARFDAIERSYSYLISTLKNPFRNDSHFYHPMPLNIDAMNKACQILFKHTDFTSFSKLHTDTKTNNCTIKKAHWTINDDELVFHISADRFLRNMVRAIVGTMIEVGKEKISINDFENIIKNRNRSDAGRSVPGHALYLVKVNYPYPV